MPESTFTQAEAQQVLDYQIEFGKHKGTAIKKLVKGDATYAMWVMGQGESNNKAFTKAQMFFKLVMGWGDAVVDGVFYPELVSSEPDGAAHVSAGVTISNAVLGDLGISPDEDSYQFTWVSMNSEDPETFKFTSSDDFLQYAMLLEKWKTYDDDYFVVIKRTWIGDMLMKHMPRSLMDFENGRFLNVAA